MLKLLYNRSVSFSFFVVVVVFKGKSRNLKHVAEYLQITHFNTLIAIHYNYTLHYI